MPKSQNPPRSVNLAIYLLKDSCAKARDALRPAGRPRAVHRVTIGDAKGTLHAEQVTEHAPNWVKFFGKSASPDLALVTSSAAAVLFVKRGSRLFALTFGHGRHMLEPGQLEESFGLKVTLNSIDAGRIKSIDHKTFEAITRHTRTQASHEGTAADFGLDVERDMVRVVTGEPRKREWGRRMTGMDALVVAANVALEGIPELLDTYLERFESEDYKKDFAWVDKISEVRDPALKTTLDDALVARLGQTDPGKLWMAVPQLVEWSDIGGFRYRARDEDLVDDLHLGDFLTAQGSDAALSLDFLKKRRVFAVRADETTPYDDWPAYNCLYAEHDEQGETYILTGGKWYRVASDFVAEVNAAIAPLVASAPVLPPFEPSDKDESGYNKRVAAGNKAFALVDRKPIAIGGGHSSFEFCDLYSAYREIIHIKRYGGASAPLSHLFAQGLNAAVIFASHADSRRKANEILPASLRIKNPDKKPDTSSFTLVYAVVSHSQQAIDKSLPFFSRLSLRYAARQLDMLGYRVSLVRIPGPRKVSKKSRRRGSAGV
jgi:uncharacterized protein (TIGR04141 family)